MVKWTSTAKMDLKKIYDYIAEDSKYYARQVAEDYEVKNGDVDILAIIHGKRDFFSAYKE
jgi:plasmid stabilization system protein ParE